MKQIYPVSNMSAALSQWFKVLYNFRYGGRAPLPFPSPPLPVPAGLFHCVSRISILRSLDLNRLTGELSGITVSRFINVVNLVSKCFLARVWCLYLSLSLTLWCEKRRLAGSRQRENKASTRAKDYPSILRSISSSHLIVNRSLTHLSRALETKLKRTFPFLFPPFSYLLNFSLDRSTRDHRFDSITCCINRRNEASKVFEIESLFSLEARNKMLRVLPLNT